MRAHLRCSASAFCISSCILTATFHLHSIHWFGTDSGVRGWGARWSAGAFCIPLRGSEAFLAKGRPSVRLCSGVRGSGYESKNLSASPHPKRIRSRSVPVSDSTQGLGVRGSGSESKKTLASPLPGRIKSRSVPLFDSAQGLGVRGQGLRLHFGKVRSPEEGETRSVRAAQGLGASGKADRSARTRHHTGPELLPAKYNTEPHSPSRSFAASGRTPCKQKPQHPGFPCGPPPWY